MNNTSKINSYNLPQETKNKMVELISKTIKYKTEHGFNLCLDKNNNIRHGKLCKGRKCSIETAKFECKKDEKIIGIFHTHKISLLPSVSDLHLNYLGGINCIGSYEGIKCFKRKKEELDASEYADIRLTENREQFLKWSYDRLKSKDITEKEYRSEYEKYRNEINRLVNSYFNVIDVKVK